MEMDEPGCQFEDNLGIETVKHVGIVFNDFLIFVGACGS